MLANVLQFWQVWRSIKTISVPARRAKKMKKMRIPAPPQPICGLRKSEGILTHRIPFFNRLRSHVAARGHGVGRASHRFPRYGSRYTAGCACRYPLGCIKKPSWSNETQWVIIVFRFCEKVSNVQWLQLRYRSKEKLLPWKSYLIRDQIFLTR